VIGLPNDQWGSRTKALGWRNLFPLVWRIRPLRFDRLVERRAGRIAGSLAAPIGFAYARWWRAHPSSTREIQIRRASSADVFDDIWARRTSTHSAAPSRTPTHPVTIVRDAAWINWRYFSVPDIDYRVDVAERNGDPSGYCVSRLRVIDGRRMGYIAELATVGDDLATERALIDHAVRALTEDDAELVASLARPETTLDRALRAAGFLFSWGQFDVQMVPLGAGGVASMDDVFGGDFDVV
jgi:hypothetical protein